MPNPPKRIIAMKAARMRTGSTSTRSRRKRKARRWSRLSRSWSRGTNARVEKSEAVATAGGAGMVLYNTVANDTLNTDNHFVPSLHVAKDAGEAIKAYIDGAAQYKINRLHLHLTDDQGWRIDVPSRPQLVDVASKTAVGDDPGGYYSADDLAELTAYARARGIILPAAETFAQRTLPHRHRKCTLSQAGPLG